MVLRPATGTKYTDSNGRGQPLSGGFPLSGPAFYSLADHAPAIDEQREEYQTATGHLRPRHAFTEPAGGEQGNPYRLQYHNYHAMAVGGQALGVGLKKKTSSGTDHGAGDDPHGKDAGEVVERGCPGFEKCGFNKGDGPDDEQSNGCQGQGWYALFFNGFAQTIDHGALIGCTSIQSEEQGKDTRRDHEEKLPDFRAESVF